MDLQMQLRRALIALILSAVLGGVALTRAGSGAGADAALHATEPRTLPAVLHVGQTCPTQVRLDLGALRVSVACDRHCALVHDAAQALGLAPAVQPASCTSWHTA